MANILVISSGLTSKYLTHMELTRRLQILGHEVCYASQGSIEAVVAAQGLPFLRLRGEAPNKPKTYYRQNGALAKLLQFVGKFLTIRQRQKKAIRAFEIEHFLATVANVNPDVLIIDIELHPQIMAAYSIGKPVLLTCSWLSIFEHPNSPPMNLYELPGNNVRKSWQGFRRWKKQLLLKKRIHTVGEDAATLYKLLGKQLNFPIDNEIDDEQWILPFSYRNLPVLMLSSLEMDFPREPFPVEHHIGPLILKNRSRRKFSPGEEESLENILSQHRNRKGGKKLVHCAFGTNFQGDRSLDFFTKVVKAADTLSQFDFVFGLGGRLDEIDFDEIPKNVYLFSWVPQLDVLRVADAAIIHSGNATINECVYYGVPMLLYPNWSTADQAGAASRAEYHKLGYVGDRNCVRPDEIASELLRLMNDKEVQSAVDNMRLVIHNAEESTNLSDILDQMI